MVYNHLISTYSRNQSIYPYIVFPHRCPSVLGVYNWVVADLRILRQSVRGKLYPAWTGFVKQKRDYPSINRSINQSISQPLRSLPIPVMVVLPKPLQLRSSSLNTSININDNQWGILSPYDLSSQCDPNNIKTMQCYRTYPRHVDINTEVYNSIRLLIS